MAQTRQIVSGEWTPSAVVFDCDGLLVDTEPCWVQAEAMVFERRGLEFDAPLRAEFIGRSMLVNATAMAELFGERGAEQAILEEVHDAVLELVRRTATALPGARELVELVAASVPVAVATNSPRFLLEAALARGGFEGAFEVSVSVDDVANPKPHPEIYATACKRLAVEAPSALAFEDSLTGLRSARAAGMVVAGVPTLEHADGEFAADRLYESLTDPALVSWVTRWRAA